MPPVPAAGVPDNSPAGLRVKPAGSGLVVLQLNDDGVPVAANWKVVALLPAVKAGMEFEVMLADSCTVKLNACVVVCTVPMVLDASMVKL